MIVAVMLLGYIDGYAGAPAVHFGFDSRKMTASECSLKAVEAMAIKQNFIHAELSGSEAWGYNEKSFVFVHAVPILRLAGITPTFDRVEILVVVFGTDNREAERLRNEIRAHVFDGPYNQRISKTYTTSDANRRKMPRPVAVHWGNFDKHASEATVQSLARAAMERNNFHASTSGKQVVLGTANNAQVLSFGVDAGSATQTLVIAASSDSKTAERFRNEVRSYIVRAVAIDNPQ